MPETTSGRECRLLGWTGVASDSVACTHSRERPTRTAGEVSTGKLRPWEILWSGSSSSAGLPPISRKLRRLTQRRGHIGATRLLCTSPGPAGWTHGECGGAGDPPFSGDMATDGAERVKVVDVAAPGMVGLFEIVHRTASSSNGQKDEGAGHCNHCAIGDVEGPFCDRVAVGRVRLRIPSRLEPAAPGAPGTDTGSRAPAPRRPFPFPTAPPLRSAIPAPTAGRR
jgi:hypothetical protein